jgi:hypothetical protein
MDEIKTSELAESEIPLYQPAQACARYEVAQMRKNKSRHRIKAILLLTSKMAIFVQLH